MTSQNNFLRGNKVNITVQGSKSSITIPTFVRYSFLYADNIFVFRCNANIGPKEIENLGTVTNSRLEVLTCSGLEIEGVRFVDSKSYRGKINPNIFIICDPRYMLDPLHIVVKKQNNGKFKLLNIFTDNMSYLSTFRILGNL